MKFKFLAEKDLEQLCMLYDLNYSKVIYQRLIIVSIALILSLVFCLKQNFQLVALILAVSYMLFKNDYFNLKKKEKIDFSLKKNEFSNFLKCFLSLLFSSQNVYEAIVESTKFVKPPLLNLLEQFIHEINEDKGITPYIKFAKQFELVEIHQIMMLIYQFNQKGYNEDIIDKLAIIIDKLQANVIEQNIERKLLKYDFAPSVIIIFLTIFIFSFAILSIMSSLNGII